MSYTCQSEYLDTSLDRAAADRVIKELIKFIKASQVEFDSIAFRGMSGALIAPIVAFKMKKDLILVRKKESSHSNHAVEGNKATRRYIIIDDFVGGGTTLDTIVSTINNDVNFREARPVAIFLYRSCDAIQSRGFILIKSGELKVEVPQYALYMNVLPGKAARKGTPIPKRKYNKKTPIGNVELANSLPGVSVAA
jgi:hypothetical protein